MRYQVQFLIEGEWVVASSHSQEVDAEDQKVRFDKPAEEIRIIEVTE